MVFPSRELVIYGITHVIFSFLDAIAVLRVAMGWLGSIGVELHDWIWLHTSVNLEMDMIVGFIFFLE
jgi:hypothetical protein